MLSEFLSDPDVDIFSVLLRGLVLVLCLVVLFCWAAYAGELPVAVRLFSQVENSLFADVALFSSAVRLLGFWFVGVDFMLVRGVSFFGRLNPGAMFVSGLCSAALERERKRVVWLPWLFLPRQLLSIGLL